MAKYNPALANHAKEVSALRYSLITNASPRRRIAIEEAMAQAEREALTRKRAAEDAIRALDEAKAKHQSRVWVAVLVQQVLVERRDWRRPATQTSRRPAKPRSGPHG